MFCTIQKLDFYISTTTFCFEFARLKTVMLYDEKSRLRGYFNNSLVELSCADALAQDNCKRDQAFRRTTREIFSRLIAYSYRFDAYARCGDDGVFSNMQLK